MPSSEDAKPLMWVNGGEKENVVILTDKSLYVATVTAKQLPDVDLGLEEGEAPEALIQGKLWKVGVTRLTRLQYKESRQFPNQSELTLFYDDEGIERKQHVSLGQKPLRDEFVEKLTARLGWVFHARSEARGWVFLRYFGIIAAISLGTGVCSAGYLTGWITHAPGAFVMCVDLFGVWGILGAGVFVALLVFVACIKEIVHPADVVTCEPPEIE